LINCKTKDNIEFIDLYRILKILTFNKLDKSKTNFSVSSPKRINRINNNYSIARSSLVQKCELKFSSN